MALGTLVQALTVPAQDLLRVQPFLHTGLAQIGRRSPAEQIGSSWHRLTSVRNVSVPAARACLALSVKFPSLFQPTQIHKFS